MTDPWDRERAHYDKLYGLGHITREEHNEVMQQIDIDERDSLRADAEEAAERAYNDTIGNW
jgi:hypothetical protein